MPTKVLSAALIGLEAEIIEVEADAGGGDFGQISIVGLPDTATAEAKERVKSALRNCDYEFPKRKITVNLAPANIKKHGPAYDLPIAISILDLKNKFMIDFRDCLIVGELSLSGEVRAVAGILAIALKAAKTGIKHIFVPAENISETNLIPGLKVYPVKTLKQLANHLRGKDMIISDIQTEISRQELLKTELKIDFAAIRGQEKAKRALEIAAAGGHNVLMSGPPGSGKTMLAQAMPGIMPLLSAAEALEVANIYSIAGRLKAGTALAFERPFRSPHHSSSGVALVGGGSWPRPGEISLAHRGVLFLDEFPEFSRNVLENLRQPLEEKTISVSRSAYACLFPCNFILIAAMNPCPCGYYGDRKAICRCPETKIANYRRKISGPIMDRIDIHLNIRRLAADELITAADGEGSDTVRIRVAAARKRQKERFASLPFTLNSDMPSEAVRRFCRLDGAGKNLMAAATARLDLSPRSYFRVLKIARTIADLDGSPDISTHHLAEALQYRPPAL